MGERGARNEPATPDDIERMAAIVREAVEAGAVGVSTSRTILHKAVDGEPVPGTFAAEDELFMLGRALADAGRGVFELAPAGIQGEDMSAPDKEIAWMRRLAAETGRPITYGLPAARRRPARLGAPARGGRRGPRRRHPAPPAGHRAAPSACCSGSRASTRSSTRPTYLALTDLPLAERVAELRKPDGAGRDPRRGRPRPVAGAT